jgi:hypothetical protein
MYTGKLPDKVRSTEKGRASIGYKGEVFGLERDTGPSAGCSLYLSGYGFFVTLTSLLR